MQQKKVGVPGIIGGMCALIVSIFAFKELVDLFSEIDHVTSSEASYYYAIVVACVEFLIGYVMVGVGSFQSKYGTIQKGFTAIGSGTTLDIFIVLLLLERSGYFRYANSETNKYLIGLLLCSILCIIAYFMAAKNAKNVLSGVSVRSRWYIPGCLFLGNLLLQLIMIGEISGSASGVAMNLNELAVLQTLSMAGMLFMVGLEMYLQENPNALAGFRPQQPMYGQPQQPMYGQPQQPMYGQPQQPMYGQPQQPMYGQPQQPMYGQPQQPMYGQPQNNGQNNNQ